MERIFVVVLGPAGSGKSTLTWALGDYIHRRGTGVVLVNLDPAAESLPYEPHVDVRDYVRVEDFIGEGLGPNGAVVAAVASLVNFAEEIRNAIEEYNAPIVLLDTPGQMEVFAYRVSGPFAVASIVGDSPAMTLFLMDAPFFEDPLSMVSVLSLASSIFVRFKLPQVNLVSKADLLRREIIEEVIPRLGEEGFLETLIDDYSRVAGVDPLTRDLAIRLAEAVRESGFIGEILPYSVHDEESLKTIYAKILQVFTGGEEPVERPGEEEAGHGE